MRKLFSLGSKAPPKSLFVKQLNLYFPREEK